MRTSIPLDSRLRQILAYPKLRHEHLRVLLVRAEYHTVAESHRALSLLGHQVQLLPVLPSRTEMLRSMMLALARYRPDFVLAVNHLGFDAQGDLARLLDDVRMPTAVWYVDSPEFTLGDTRVRDHGHTTLFVWERAWMEPMRRFGFEDVQALPLATDPTFMNERRGVRLERELCFVGNSMVEVQDWWARNLSPASMAKAQEVASRLRQSRALAELEALRRDLPPSQINDAIAYCTWLATGESRRALLQRIGPEHLTLIGDPGWQRSFPEATLLPQVAYGEPLAHVYRTSAINLNTTSCQMPTTVNQRVFDVPACGGFLLTDAQPELRELFSSKEVATYNSADEAADLATHFLRHPGERLRIIHAARKRVLREHTYRHRLERLVAHMRQRHAAAPHVGGGIAVSRA